MDVADVTSAEVLLRCQERWSLLPNSGTGRRVQDREGPG